MFKTTWWGAYNVSAFQTKMNASLYVVLNQPCMKWCSTQFPWFMTQWNKNSSKAWKVLLKLYPESWRALWSLKKEKDRKKEYEII